MKQKYWNIFLTCLLVCCVMGGCKKEQTDTPTESPADIGEEISYRQEYVADPEAEKEYVDTDGDFTYEIVDWAGPEGYVIVISDENTEAKKTAELLQNYYSQTHGVTLNIVTDKEQEIEKEILIGDTDRSQSRKNMEEKELAVSVDGSKLVFAGGHNVTVRSAVEKFIRLAPDKGKACTFSVTTDFASTVMGDYHYVWGDEFEGTSLDMDKFCFVATMRGTEQLEISTDEDVIKVEDGRLKLNAIRYFNPVRKGTKYKTGLAVSTRDTMNYVYGYAEIRARVPFYRGAWPSFWTQSGDWLSGTMNADYMVEVDIFEVMGSPKELESTIHKWYNDGTRTDYEVRKWNYEDFTKLNEEYHTYGFEWTPTEVSMYVDGEKYTTFDITKSTDDRPDMSGFHDPKCLIFNDYIMNSDLDWYKNLPEAKDFPYEYFIDYVRLYQKTGEGKLYTK